MKLNDVKKYFHLIVFVIILSSCKKEKAVDNTPSTFPVPLDKSILVINEGTFNRGNASITYYNRGDSSSIQDVFGKENDNKPMGDVFQSMIYHQNYFYCVLNNSGKILQLDGKTLKYVNEIKIDKSSPRYIIKDEKNNKGYITDLYANKIYILNFATNSIEGDIAVPGYAETGIIAQDSLLFVCMVKRHSVYVINTRNKSIIDSIKVGEEPQWMVQSKDNNIYVLSNYFDRKSPCSLHKIDINTRKVTDAFNFPSIKNNPQELRYSAVDNSLYWLESDGVYRINIQQATDKLMYPTAPMFLHNIKNVYGFGWDEFNKEFYISDAGDFIQNGTVYRFNYEGKLIHMFKAGIIPGDFWIGG
jgi:DNA-binding beta-propeller fold protein YncE